MPTAATIIEALAKTYHETSMSDLGKPVCHANSCYNNWNTNSSEWMPVRNTINHRQHQPDENQPLPKLTLQTIKQSCSLSSCSDALEHMRCKLDNKTITHVITKLLCTAQCKLQAWAERTRTMLGTVGHIEYQLQPQQPVKTTDHGPQDRFSDLELGICSAGKYLVKHWRAHWRLADVHTRKLFPQNCGRTAPPNQK